jgi:Bacterial PH domain
MKVALNNQDNLIWSKGCFPNKIATDEDLILVIRQDISILILHALKFLFIFLILLVLQIVLMGQNQPLLLAIYDTIFFCVNCVMIVAFALFFHDFYLSLQIVTSKRIIDVDQKGLFNRQTEQMPISNIQDVAFKQSGLASILFNFGDVVVQSDGNTLENTGVSEKLDAGFVFNNVPSPSEITALISNLYHDEKKKLQVEVAKTNAEYIRQALQNNQIPNISQ